MVRASSVLLWLAFGEQIEGRSEESRADAHVLGDTALPLGALPIDALQLQKVGAYARLLGRQWRS